MRTQGLSVLATAAPVKPYPRAWTSVQHSRECSSSAATLATSVGFTTPWLFKNRDRASETTVPGRLRTIHRA